MLSRAEEKLVRALATRKGRESERAFVAEGVRVVEELLAAGIDPRLTLVSSSLEDTERGALLARRLRERGDVREVPEGELKRLADTRTTQGVLAVAPLPGLELAGVRVPDSGLALVLDGVQDPGNLGTLARSAAAFGAVLLAALPGTVDPWNAKSVRASAGALFRMPVVQAEPEEAWQWLGAGEFTALGADAAGEPVDAVQVPGRRVALVVGNEGAGLSPAARAHCERLVAVPMSPGSESLNVAVAAGILMYELGRNRG